MCMEGKEPFRVVNVVVGRRGKYNWSGLWVRRLGQNEDGKVCSCGWELQYATVDVKRNEIGIHMWGGNDTSILTTSQFALPTNHSSFVTSLPPHSPHDTVFFLLCTHILLVTSSHPSQFPSPSNPTYNTYSTRIRIPVKILNYGNYVKGNVCWCNCWVYHVILCCITSPLSIFIDSCSLL